MRRGSRAWRLGEAVGAVVVVVVVLCRVSAWKEWMMWQRTSGSGSQMVRGAVIEGVKWVSVGV